MISHWGIDNMTRTEAKDFLTHYICCCPFGNSPINCGDEKCAFGIAVRTLCEEAEEIEEPITLTDEQITEMYESGYISDKEEFKDGND